MINGPSRREIAIAVVAAVLGAGGAYAAIQAREPTTWQECVQRKLSDVPTDRGVSALVGTCKMRFPDRPALESASSEALVAEVNRRGMRIDTRKPWEMGFEAEPEVPKPSSFDPTKPPQKPFP